MVEGGEGSDLSALPEVSCSGLEEWAQNTVYPTGTKVTDTGDVFEARSGHTAFGIDWNPKRAASLWLAVARCDAGGGGVVVEPPAPPPPPPPPPPVVDNDPPPVVDPPEENDDPPVPAQCEDDGRPGPRFDVAGDKNVGNGIGQQFIGGRCLGNEDCASGCCANPCGICSGPGAQFQAGKQGCGFDI